MFNIHTRVQGKVKRFMKESATEVKSDPDRLKQRWFNA